MNYEIINAETLIVPEFYGKMCNYRFGFYDADDDYDVFFLLSKEDCNKSIDDLPHGHFNSVDTCILWAAYHLFVEPESGFTWHKIKIQNADVEIENEFNNQDELVEAMWETLEDVNIDENECIEQPWFVFDVGTDREYIWHWFDEHHSRGVGWLMNEYESQ